MEPGVIPSLSLVGARKAIDFYKQAFAAEELAAMPAEDGARLMHAHILINGGSVMLSDAFPEMGMPHQPSNSFVMQLLVPDAQVWWDRALAAGCEVVVPLEKQFWGDIFGQLKDPFGVNWAFNQPDQ
ncbi:MAG: VOC family protein [Caulobacteraceae bacterium]|nr:VOC family protein [Caulobacteraceae bacterium]